MLAAAGHVEPIPDCRKDSHTRVACTLKAHETPEEFEGRLRAAAEAAGQVADSGARDTSQIACHHNHNLYHDCNHDHKHNLNHNLNHYHNHGQRSRSRECRRRSAPLAGSLAEQPRSPVSSRRCLDATDPGGRAWARTDHWACSDHGCDAAPQQLSGDDAEEQCPISKYALVRLT